MNEADQRIGVVGLGEPPEIALQVVAANIEAHLSLEAEILPAMDIPPHAFDSRRLQHDAARVLQALRTKDLDRCDKVIGVLDVDLFIPVLTHVFGEAEQAGRCAVVSLHRLRRNPDGTLPTQAALWERLAKVALHELGHLYSLLHCMDAGCLMHFSGGIRDLDESPLSFCRYCLTYLRDALHCGGAGAQDPGPQDLS